MFRFLSIDVWQELLSTLSRNKLRTTLTAFSVAWGIFILVILLGVGNGLQNGTENSFSGDAANSIWLNPGRTTIPYKGMPINRRITLENSDYQVLKENIEGTSLIAARYSPPVSMIARNGKKYASFDIKACHPDYKFVENMDIVAGRFINQKDLDDQRKTAIISTKVQAILFEKEEDPVGQYISLGGRQFRVAGVFVDEGGERDMNRIYLPLTTVQHFFKSTEDVQQIAMLTNEMDVDKAEGIRQNAHQLMAQKYQFSPEDTRAVRVSNNVKRYLDVMSLLHGIKIFLWIVGSGTIVAGVVGVSNIMLISVHERTKEIGIRKAIGATPFSVMSMILGEALILTLLSGYLGLLAGVGLLSLTREYLPDNEMFQNPDINFTVALTAMGIMAAAGLLAGFFPAWRAARIRPVEALRG